MLAFQIQSKTMDFLISKNPMLTLNSVLYLKTVQYFAENNQDENGFIAINKKAILTVWAKTYGLSFQSMAVVGKSQRDLSAIGFIEYDKLNNITLKTNFVKITQKGLDFLADYEKFENDLMQELCGMQPKQEKKCSGNCGTCKKEKPKKEVQSDISLIEEPKKQSKKKEQKEEKQKINLRPVTDFINQNYQTKFVASNWPAINTNLQIFAKDVFDKLKFYNLLENETDFEATTKQINYVITEMFKFGFADSFIGDNGKRTILSILSDRIKSMLISNYFSVFENKIKEHNKAEEMRKNLTGETFREVDRRSDELFDAFMEQGYTAEEATNKTNEILYKEFPNFFK